MVLRHYGCVGENRNLCVYLAVSIRPACIAIAAREIVFIDALY